MKHNAHKDNRSAAATKQRGQSTITIAIVIAVGSIIIIAALIYGIRYFAKAKVQNEVSAIVDLRTNVVSYGDKVGLFNATNGSLAALVGMNFFPQVRVGGTPAAPTVSNQWGGSITTGLGTLVNAGDSLNFTQTGIPANACSELGISLDSVAAVVTINGTTTKAAGAVTDPAAVGTSCGGAAGDNNVMVITLAK